MFPQPIPKEERFAALKVGAKMELKHRVTGTWTEVTIKSVDSGEALTCSVTNDKNKILIVSIIELRDLL